jgi:alpha-D-ribose 1-methylphosphonate 5-triphosphate synthase subunit PhnL
VLGGVSFTVAPGECVVLGGPSGAGKSSILKIVYGNYAADSGAILLDGDSGDAIDIATAGARAVLAARRATIGYVSQFLRVVPRVAARDIVAEPLTSRGVAREEAHARAEALLERLNLPRRLWDLPPATFSGGEQQRINVARGFIARYPLLLLDEPTASLDAANREVVVDLIREAKAEGASFLGIFHDEQVRNAVADRVIDVTGFAPA